MKEKNLKEKAGSLGSQVLRLQVLGILSLHNHMGQFLILSIDR